MDTPLSVLSSELQQLCVEVRSESLPSRNKAIERLDNILSCRKSDVIDIITHSEYGRRLSWTTLFNNVFEGVVKHSIKLDESKHLKSFTTLKNKNYLFSAVINKIIENSIEAKTPLKCGLLVEEVTNGIENSLVFEHFNTLLFQIIEKGFVAIGGSLAGVKTPELSNLLKLCLTCYGEDAPNGRNLSLLRCINKILDLGTKYSLVCITLPHHVENVRIICNSAANDASIQHEIIKLVHQYVCNIVTDCHIEIANFLQRVMPAICGYYDFRMKLSVKELLFELCAIFLGIHYLDLKDFNSIVPINDEDEWKTLMKKLFSLVKMEIREKSRELNKDTANTYCDSFLLFASMISCVVYWNPIFESQKSDEQRKIAKFSTKFQGLLDMAIAGNNVLNWGWFTILSECMTMYPHLVDVTDFQLMLQTILSFQKATSSTNQIKALSKCCAILLKKEIEFTGNKFLNIDYCNNQWKEISELAISQLLQKSLVSEERQILVQLLIDYKKLSDETILALIRSLITNTAFRIDTTLITLRVAIKHHKDAILSSPEIVKDLFRWLYPLTVRLDVNSMLNDRILDANLMADVVACLILEGEYVIDTIGNFTTFSAPHSPLFRSIQTIISFNHLKKIVFIESRKQMRNTELECCDKKIVINDEYFKVLLKTIDFNPQAITQQDSSDLLNNMSKLETIIALLDSFSKRGKFDKNDLCISAVMKKAAFLLNAVEFQLGELNVSTDVTNIKDILQKLQSIIGILNNPVLNSHVRSGNNYSIIKYLSKSLVAFAEENDMYETEDLIYRRKLALDCMRVLALCDIPSDLFGCINHFEVYLDQEREVDALLNIIGIFCKHKQQTHIAKWIISNVQDICKSLHENSKISLHLIHLLPDIARYIKPYSNYNVDIVIVLSSFLKKCYRKSYPPTFVQDVINVVRDVSKTFNEMIEDENLMQIYESIPKFLTIPNKSIQYAAVDCLNHLIDDRWLFENKTVPFEHLNLCNALFDAVTSIDISELDVSYKSPYPAVLQFLLGALSLNYSTEERAILLLMNHGFLNREDSAQTIQEIGKFLNRDMMLVFKHNLIPVMLQWFTTNENGSRDFKNPPWSPFVHDEMDFLNKYSKILYFCALYSDTDMPRKLANRLSSNIQKELKEIQSICASSLLPYFCNRSINFVPNGCNTGTLIANMHRLNMKTDLEALNPQSTWEVLYFLIKNIWDQQMFSELCGFGMIWPQQHTIDCNAFTQCIEKLLSIHYTDKDTVLAPLLKHKPLQIIHFLTAIKIDFEDSYCLELKLITFFQYCVALRCIISSFIKEFHGEKLSKIRGYLIRDSLYYLCNILQNPKENNIMIRAAVHFLKKLCQSLLPNHADYLESNLNIIVLTQVAVISKSLSKEITKTCTDTLNLLVCQNRNTLGKSLAILDDFPMDDMFKELRKVHEQIKYENQKDSLLEEINYFLQVENRGITGYQNLRKWLAAKKNELNSLCDFMDKSIEEIRKSSLFKLLKVLLTAIKGKNDEISSEAASCLGELGPINLTTIALFSDMKEACYENFYSTEEAMEYFIGSILDSIEHILIMEKCKKVVLAIDIGQYVLNTKVGKKCLAKSPLLHIFGENFDNKLNSWSPVDEIPFLNILKSTEDLNYNSWIVKFTSEIYTSINHKALEKLAETDVHFCEQTLIAFIKVLLSGDANSRLSIEQLVNIFFEEVYKSLKDPHKNSSKIYTDKATVKYFLNIAECVRIHSQNFKTDLKINYHHVAKASVYCEAYFMAVLCLEMWALLESNKVLESDDFQSIAREAFTCIGCLDAISGFLSPIDSRLEFLSLQNHWDAVLLELDAQPLAPNSSVYEGYLKQNGFYSLASKLDSKKQDYEVLWRLGNWDVTKNECKRSFVECQADLENSFQMHHYLALRSLKKMEEENVFAAIDSAQKAVVSILKLVSSECAQNIYKYITWLEMIQQIVDFCELQFPKQNDPIDILRKWDYSENIDYGHFDYKELLTTQKVTLFNMAGIRADRKIKEYYKGDNIAGELLLNLILECKSSGNKNLIVRNIAKLKNMDIPNELKTKVFIEDADIHWKMGNIVMAKAILHHTAKTETYAFCFKRVDALRIYGEYLAESNSESFNTINKRFFMAASKLLDNFTSEKERIAKTRPRVLRDYEMYSAESRKNICRSVAKYADREYNQIDSYINSDDFQLKIKLMGKNKIDANSIRQAKSYKTNRDELCTLNILAQNAGIDDYEIKTIATKRANYLCLAIENYIQFCIFDENIKPLEIFRFISLWFSNKESEDVTEKIKENIASVPSYKFICVLNQITARLSSGESEFDKHLQNLLERCSIDHPHHTLPFILAIAHANLDSSSSKVNPRIEIAKNILDTSSKDESTAAIIDQMQKASKILIEFANKDGKTCVHNTIPDNLRRLKNLNNVQCHTLDIPISINKDYNITSIIKWKDKFTFVGGINAPKKVTCLCSDGVERPQLLKGKDDLRQDAIMQQIFGIVNDMLLHEKDTRKRKMKIRTYKVVPFSMRSGILEWCENTIPLGLYLTGEKKNGGAHKKFRPNDYSPDKCIKQLLEKHKESPEERYAAFIDVCEHFQPVFHNFFFENFLHPDMWFEKRLAYINSVAITSMVGYILGLGDRHVQNILIDQISAEVIHIDFGIAFEQGKVMPTPETVPFRLTRDVVAPFGVCGVEGIFRKSCEKTMEVMRENQMVLMTVLEVLLYDPLYIWIVKTKTDTEKIECDTNIDKEQKNATAQRALIRIKAKLMGMEETGSSINSVEGQVQRLIKQAMDLRNLSLLYPGWNPHI